MPEEKKDFFNIAKMTEVYRTPDSDLDPRSIYLAIAQQLAVISGHLARISETLDVALERAKKS